MRTGSEFADRVKDLESQISELESESDRLSQALDAQKARIGEMEVAAGRKADDVAREIQSKVRVRLLPCEVWMLSAVKVYEIEQLKMRLKQYGDYDEIKRELEIMKVGYSQTRTPRRSNHDIQLIVRRICGPGRRRGRRSSKRLRHRRASTKS